MRLNDVGTVIATREFDLLGGRKVTVLIGKPERFPGEDDYYCPYQIVGIGSGRIRYAGGIDAVQALELTLKMVGTDLYTSSEAQAKELSWSGGKNGDLGLPVPNVLSDIPPPQP